MSTDSPDASPQLEAERATLGACLLDPRQLTDLREWLRPAHFLRPAHSRFYAILLEQHKDAGAAVTSEERRDWALNAITSATRSVRGFSQSYGQSLIAACPTPGHATAYGRMVLETAVRRSLEEHAHRLLAAAESGSVRDTVELTGTLHAVIEQLACAWGSTDRRSTRAMPVAEATTALGRAGEAARGHERMLLSVLIGSPGQISEVASWLTPEDLLGGANRAVFQAMTAVAHRKEPVDELTVLWEVQRRGALADGTTTVAEVRALLADDMPGDPTYWAERVLRASLLRVSATSAGIVRVMALDASMSAGALLGSSVRALAPVDRIQQRLHGASAFPAPARSGPAVLGARRRQAATGTSAVPSSAGTAEAARHRR